MPRRRRYFGTGGACCHITQRCVNGEFLLKFKCDRRNYVQRLAEGLARHAVSLLNYAVTSNHSHLLVWSERGSELSSFMQYVSGATAQDYNRRKSRHGAYWGDRYHATLVQSGLHLGRCLFYIDMNMVRAGVVAHPSEWETGGCRELMGKDVSVPLVDSDAVVRLLASSNIAHFRQWHKRTLAELCREREPQREPHWTEAAAVGEKHWIASLADRFPTSWRTIRQMGNAGESEIWTMGMSNRRREGLLGSLQ